MTAAVGTQRWIPDRYARNAGFVPELGRAVLTLLAPRPGERILDLGCGDGTLTAEIAATGAHVVGIDSSDEQIAAARARGLDAHVMDARTLRFEAPFDAVFSNAALHWMRDLDAVATAVAACLRPGGRFVGELGGAGNVATVRQAIGAALARRGLDAGAADPWTFPSAGAFGDLLERHGFEVRHLETFPRPTPLPGALDGWLETFCEPFLALLPAAERPLFVAEISDLVAPQLRRPDGGWIVDYVRLRFAAIRPGPGAWT